VDICTALHLERGAGVPSTGAGQSPQSLTAIGRGKDAGSALGRWVTSNGQSPTVPTAVPCSRWREPWTVLCSATPRRTAGLSAAARW